MDGRLCLLSCIRRECVKKVRSEFLGARNLCIVNRLCDCLGCAVCEITEALPPCQYAKFVEKRKKDKIEMISKQNRRRKVSLYGCQCRGSPWELHITMIVHSCKLFIPIFSNQFECSLAATELGLRHTQTIHVNIFTIRHGNKEKCLFRLWILLALELKTSYFFSKRRKAYTDVPVTSRRDMAPPLTSVDTSIVKLTVRFSFTAPFNINKSTLSPTRRRFPCSRYVSIGSEKLDTLRWSCLLGYNCLWV